jgi:hypothetical protein
VLGQATGNLNSQDSPRSGFGGSHQLPPYNILCASPRGSHPNDILSQDSQMGVSKFPKFRLSWFWGLIILCIDFWLKWDLKQSCSPCQELSNSMSHATCMQANWVNSWFIVVRTQIANLTPHFYFGHNLCFKCPNGSCKPILDIYVLITFQWYKELFKPLCFDPCNCSLNIRESRCIMTSCFPTSPCSPRIIIVTSFSVGML